MNASPEQSPAAARPERAWIGETLFAVGAIAALNAALAPSDPGLLHLEPHPLFAVAALIAARYGAGAGFVAGVICAAAHVAGQVVAAGASSLEQAAALVDHVRLATPLLLILSGSVLGEVRERQAQRALHQARQGERARAERDAALARLDVAERARAELERRIAEPAATVAMLYQAAVRLDATDRGEVEEAVLDIVAEHLEASACAIYAVDGGRLALRATRGKTAAPAERGLDGGLVGVALRERRVASARDRLTIPGGQDEATDALLAAPLAGADGVALGAIAIEAMPLLRLTASSHRLLDALAAWASRAIERARDVRLLRDLSGRDEELGVLRHAQLHLDLAVEVARARRYGQPLGAVVVAIEGWSDIPDDIRASCGKAVALTLAQALRNVDRAYRYRADGTFAAVLPQTGAEGVTRARARIAAELDRLALEPYRQPGRLRCAIGGAALEPGMTEPGELTRAAEPAAMRATVDPSRLAEPA